MDYDSSQAECSVPWLNEVLVLFTVGLQLCQQLKDKVVHYQRMIVVNQDKWFSFHYRSVYFHNTRILQSVPGRRAHPSLNRVLLIIIKVFLLSLIQIQLYIPNKLSVLENILILCFETLKIILLGGKSLILITSFGITVGKQVCLLPYRFLQSHILL